MKRTTVKISKLPVPFLILAYIGIFIFWFLYRYLTRFPDIIDEFIAKPIIWIGPVIIISIWKKVSFSELRFRKLSYRYLALSTIGGVGVALLQLIPLFLRSQKGFYLPSNLEMLTVATIGTAISEEVLFRGFLFRQFQKYYSTVVSIIVTSVLFSLLHIPIILFIQHMTGFSLLIGLYITFASSIMLSILYDYTKNLWSPIIAHFVLDVLLLIQIH